MFHSSGMIWFKNVNVNFDHTLLNGKRYIYYCRCNAVKPSLRAFITTVKLTYQVVTMIAKSNDNFKIRNTIWGKYVKSN